MQNGIGYAVPTGKMKGGVNAGWKVISASSDRPSTSHGS